MPAKRWTIKTHGQEICENGADNAHFTWLHGMGCIVNRAVVHAKVDLHYTFAFFPVPVDDGVIELHSMLAMKRLPNRLATWALWRKATARVMSQAW